MSSVPKPSVAWMVARVIILTILATLISFALALFFGIVGVLLVNMLRGGGIDMTSAYRHVAFPVALAALVIAFLTSLTIEIRQYRRARAAMYDYRRAA